MKKKFSTSWKGSKQPRKQRKYAANAPLHLRKKFVSVNLSKELRKSEEKRNVPVKKNDVVKIMRGKFKKKQGKVTEVKLKTGKIIVEGIQIKKADGSKVSIPLKSSNLQIVELSSRNKKRLKTAAKKEKPDRKENSKKEEVNKENKK